LLAACNDLQAEFQALGPEEKRKWPGSRPAQLIQFLRAGVDDQNVPCCEALWSSPTLLQKLQQQGATREALVLDIVSSAYAAWDQRGLTSAVRSIIILLRTEMLNRTLGNRPFRPVPLPSHMGGLTVQQIRSWIGSACTRLWLLQQLSEPQLLCERSLSSDSLELLFGMLACLVGYKPGGDVLDGAMSSE
jgi:hypothetical protein